MSIFDTHCPICGGIEWRSVERDEHGINMVIACLTCGTRRGRRQQDSESLDAVLVDNGKSLGTIQ